MLDPCTSSYLNKKRDISASRGICSWTRGGGTGSVAFRRILIQSAVLLLIIAVDAAFYFPDFA